MKITGLYLAYTNYLHGKEQAVNLFFSFNLFLQRIKDKQNSQYFNTSSNSFEPFILEQTDKTIQFFANLGAMIKLSDKLSVNQIVGSGFNTTFRAATSPFSDFSDPFIKQDWLIKTSLSYRLK